MIDALRLGMACRAAECDARRSGTEPARDRAGGRGGAGLRPGTTVVERDDRKDFGYPVANPEGFA